MLVPVGVVIVSDDRFPFAPPGPSNVDAQPVSRVLLEPVLTVSIRRPSRLYRYAYVEVPSGASMVRDRRRPEGEYTIVSFAVLPSANRYLTVWGRLVPSYVVVWTVPSA